MRYGVRTMMINGRVPPGATMGVLRAEKFQADVTLKSPLFRGCRGRGETLVS
jgi:hypothetical protein